jgi:hypothetical protein
MLHLYIIPDDQPRPDKASILPLAGELDETIVENLQQKGIIADRFDIYSTFRWGTDLIQQMRQTIQKKNMNRDADVQQLVKLFDIAEKNNCGLLAHGD